MFMTPTLYFWYLCSMSTTFGCEKFNKNCVGILNCECFHILPWPIHCVYTFASYLYGLVWGLQCCWDLANTDVLVICQKSTRGATNTKEEKPRTQFMICFLPCTLLICIWKAIVNMFTVLLSSSFKNEFEFFRKLLLICSFGPVLMAKTWEYEIGMSQKQFD